MLSIFFFKKKVQIFHREISWLLNFHKTFYKINPKKNNEFIVPGSGDKILHTKNIYGRIV